MKTIGLTIGAAGLAVCCACARGQDTSSADKRFIVDSAQGSVAEINLAKLALEKSQDQHVREFAARMIKDHEMLILSMKPLGKKLGVKDPSGPPAREREEYQVLKMKSGTEFDRAYVEEMVKDHHDDLKKFMEEEAKTSNPELKAAVAKGEKTIREHTEMIDGIARKGGLNVPPMPI